MRRAFPLSAQLLLTFVGLLIGMATVLSRAAYTSLTANLQSEAIRHVSLAAQSREQTVAQLFQLRHQRAEGFLDSLESVCTERTGSGRLAWIADCVRPMVDDFRRSERALGARLIYRNRIVRRSGQRVSQEAPSPGALVRVVRTSTGAVEYVMTTIRKEASLALQFDHAAIELVFADHAAAGRSAEVFLVDVDGQVLTAVRDGSAKPVALSENLLSRCRRGSDALVDFDFSGVRSFQSFRPLAALGLGCVGSRLPYDEVLAPAERLRGDLVKGAVSFVIVGIVLSLGAAHWIAAPVRRLALSARKLQTGQFERPLPLGGPSEVRELGRAFNAMGNDLAELVAKEQAARREAENANRSKDDFLATVSHELRTPLTAVLGWAHMLQADNVPPDHLRHGLAVIERSARAQNRLIDDLLDVSRIVSDRLNMVREPVSLTQVVAAALDQFRPQAEAKHLELHSYLSDSALVLGDFRRLEQVVGNLLANAIKFTEPPGHITIRLQCEGRQSVLAVSDTGVGISSSFLPHVFEWFRQADARSRSQSGLGLGLGIVRQIVQLHGGSVRAESAGAGQGATFTVTLPVYQPATQPAPTTVRPTQPTTSSVAHRLDTARVLVVEDDEDARELVRRALEFAGASVDTAANAAAARREMLSDPPDVLISDIRMPEEDGYSLIRSLRNAGVTTPAIALTAYARQADADEARAAGFQVHMAKPVDAGQLVDAVARLLMRADIH
jgi:signal transduction histidine kinase/ActR/RegA family two-component response regulator